MKPTASLNPAPVQNSPSTRRYTPLAVQNSPSTRRYTPLAVQNSPNNHRRTPSAVQNSPSARKNGCFCPKCLSRENFVPLAEYRSRAGRILYRTQGRDGASHDSTPGPTCVEGAGGTGVEGTGGTGGHGRASRHRAWPRCRVRPVDGASMGWRGQRQTNFARNFRRSFFETAQKRCNSNE